MASYDCGQSGSDPSIERASPVARTSRGAAQRRVGQIVLAGVTVLAFSLPAAADPINETQILEPDAPIAGMDFGYSVALSAEWLFVGVPGPYNDGCCNGNVYMYRPDGADWVRNDEDLNPDSSSVGAGSRFGQSLAMDELDNGFFFLTIGQGRGGSIFGTVSARVTTKISDGSDWLSPYWSVANPALTNEYFSASVAVSGTGSIATAMAGATNRPGAGVTFSFENGTSQDVDPPVGNFVASRPYGLAISGDRAAIGAANTTGVAIYDRIPGSNEFAFTSMIDRPDGASAFGQSLAIQGNYLLVGAPTTTVGGLSRAGRAYLFDLDSPAEPLQVYEAPDPVRYERLGRSVAFGADTIALAAPGGDQGINFGRANGRVFIFHRSSGQVVSELEASTPSLDDYFGFSMAYRGNTVVVGAPKRDGQGAVFVFELPVVVPSLDTAPLGILAVVLLGLGVFALAVTMRRLSPGTPRPRD